MHLGDTFLLPFISSYNIGKGQKIYERYHLSGVLLACIFSGNVTRLGTRGGGPGPPERCHFSVTGGRGGSRKGDNVTT